MRHPRRPAISTRTAAVALALLANALLLLPFLLGNSEDRRRSAGSLQFVSLWPVMPPPDEPVPEEPTVEPPTVRTPPPPPSPPAVPTRAITLEPAIAPDVSSPSTEAVVTPSRGARPGIDWNAAASAAGARFAQELEAQKTFSPPPEVLREPCVPRPLDAATRQLMAEALPEPPELRAPPDSTANCVMVGGRPRCVMPLAGIGIGARREAAGDLFENMHEKRKASSVPDPHYCD